MEGDTFGEAILSMTHYVSPLKGNVVIVSPRKL